MRSILIQLARFDYPRAIYQRCMGIPILNTLLRTIVRRLLPYGTRVWASVSKGEGKGLWLYLDPRYEVDYWRGDYEPLLQFYLCKFLKPGDVFYDIGAHMGFFSLLAARLVGPEGIVFAFEPDPDNVSRLRQHVERNALPQVRPIQKAVWSRSGYLQFQRASTFSSLNTGSVTMSYGVKSEVIKVEAVTLDRFVQSHPRPTVVKIDVEGGEIEVLKGGLNLFSRSRPLILCEVHCRENVVAFNALISPLGYTVQCLSKADTFPGHFLALP